MANLDNTNPEYSANLPIWQKIIDCDDGQDAVKDRGDTYLPRPNPSDTSDKNKKRYDQYIERALFVNFTSRTINGLVGQIVGKEPEIELPKPIEDLTDDIDGAGLTLGQQVYACLRRVSSIGRAGLLVDYPQIQDGEEVTVSMTESGEVRPTISLYDARSIDMWRTERIGSKEVLSLVKLKEQREVIDPEDIFESEYVDIYRVLRLDGEGYYYQQIWVQQKVEGSEGKTEWVQEGVDSYPLDAEGNRFDEILFTFVGAQDNEPNVDMAPMSDIADVNISHYQSSADYEELRFVCGQATPWVNIGEIQYDVWKEANKGGVRIGPVGGMVFGNGGQMGFAQAEANGMSKESMVLKQEQMASLGARVVQPVEGIKTATQSNYENQGETSILHVVAHNVSEAYELALGWFQRFIRGAEGEIKFRLNNDFSVSQLDAQQLLAVVQSWQAGAISKTAVHAYTVKNGLEDRSFEDVEEEIEENPATPKLGAGRNSNLEDDGSK